MIGFGFVDAHVPLSLKSNIIESGRAEQSTKVFGIEFVDAHGPLTLYYVSTRVDVPSNQQRCLESVLLMRTVHSRCIMFQQEWTCRDLNSGPLPCQGSDLPTDLHAHVGAFANRPLARPS